MRSQAFILVVEDDDNDALLIRRTFQNARIPNLVHTRKRWGGSP